MLLKHYNHYENRKNVKVYPLLILKYLLATSMQDRISEEMGEFFLFTGIISNFIRKIATILEKNRTCISRFIGALLFYPFFPPSFLLNGALIPYPSQSLPLCLDLPTSLLFGTVFHVLSLVSSVFNICLSIRSSLQFLNTFLLFSL